jgi:dienelactone hydrolase
MNAWFLTNYSKCTRVVSSSCKKLLTITSLKYLDSGTISQVKAMQSSARISLLSLYCVFLWAVYGQTSYAQASATAQPHKGFVILDLHIPMKAAGPRGLQALLVRPDEPGPHPLAIITHGTNPSLQARLARSPLFQLAEAMEFARRGWTAVIVMRRGNGESGGFFSENVWVCDKRAYLAVGQEAASDLRAAIEYLRTLPEVDPHKVIAVGISGGGFATVALAADPPAGLVAAINFSGGGPPFPKFAACENNLLAAFHLFGSKSSVPMLWIYSENDLTFGPEIAQKFYAAFTDGGGKARFIKAPPFEDNGHNLFGKRGIPIWTPYVDDFLKSQNLQLRAMLLPLPPPALPLQPPLELPAASKSYFDEYLAAYNQKAFAVAASGFANYASGFKNIEDAKKAALDLCQASGEQCRIAFVNNSFVSAPPRQP